MPAEIIDAGLTTKEFITLATAALGVALGAVRYVWVHQEAERKAEQERHEALDKEYRERMHKTIDRFQESTTESAQVLNEMHRQVGKLEQKVQQATDLKVAIESVVSKTIEAVSNDVSKGN